MNVPDQPSHSPLLAAGGGNAFFRGVVGAIVAFLAVLAPLIVPA